MMDVREVMSFDRHRCTQATAALSDVSRRGYHGKHTCCNSAVKEGIQLREFVYIGEGEEGWCFTLSRFPYVFLLWGILRQNEREERVHSYLMNNSERAWRAVTAIESGNAEELGRVMTDAQVC